MNDDCILLEPAYESSTRTDRCSSASKCLSPTLIVCPPCLCNFYVLFQPGRQHLVNVNAQPPQIRLGHINLLHQLLVRGGDVVEGEDAPAEAEEEHSAKGDEGPEGELFAR